MQEVFVKELDKTVKAPSGWSYTAVRIFADKYLAQRDGNNICRAIQRVADFAADGDEALMLRLYNGIKDQYFAFNSPVFFNAGVEDKPQCSACFIQGVEDDMDSILGLAVKEGQLFKHGSGTGTNLSKLRSKREHITGGGLASGPVSFMRVYDSVAGTVKSGGKTRRAAKMQILDIDHPDIHEFIGCKMCEETKARVLIKAGYSSGLDGEAYDTVAFQNANLSVRVTDAFIEAVTNDRNWQLTARTTGLTVEELPAKDLFNDLAVAAWTCGDPGIQFHDTINEWNTCSQDGEIVASNPCSEYMFFNETSCNLASLNLAKYCIDGEFISALFVKDVEDLVVAMDNIVDLAGYPTEEMARQTKKYRPLGIGFTNLGYLLVKMGMKYDSDEARDVAASITALMYFAAARQSACLASERGAYEAYTPAHLYVYNKHEEHLWADPDNKDSNIWQVALDRADKAFVLAKETGFRNAQHTVLAPTGTISFIMDCITTGIEPLYSRHITKMLAGGGTVTQDFDDPCVQTANEIPWLGHLTMMAACQPFISGAISKTVNMPYEATCEDIKDCYLTAHDLGLKAVAIYRDGCKAFQPMQDHASQPAESLSASMRGVRQPLPDVRQAITHKFSVAGQDGYLTVGLYEDGRPGEIFLHINKGGSTVSGAMDSWAIAVSIALQHGVPLQTLMDKHTFVRFEPAGFTSNNDIPMAHSLVDYIARWLLLRFEDSEKDYAICGMPKEVNAENACPECGGLMQRTGTCFACPTCGYAGGCG